jgi:hypothetical protein
MTDRLYASLFYVAFIACSSWIAVSLGEALTRAALTNFALLPSRDARLSRVDTYLAAKERQPEPAGAPVKEPLIPPAPSLKVGELAKAMDEAEEVHPDPVDDEKVGTDPKHETAIPEAQKPRVAGWSKRLPSRALPAEETSSHIIMRSLRAEM